MTTDDPFSGLGLDFDTVDAQLKAEPVGTWGTGRPAGGYKLDGESVPSVTTILDKLLAKGDGLLHWAAKEARAGRDWKDARDSAASFGSALHEACLERLLKGESYDAVAESIEPTWGADAIGVLRAFRAWVELCAPVVVAVETPLISKRHRFAGTPDLICEIDGRLTYVDLKTGKNTHEPSIWLQCAAYDLLWREHTAIGFDAVTVLHLPRKCQGKWAVKQRRDVSQYAAAFVAMREAHRLLFEI